MGKPQKEKKVGDRYNVLRKGKVIFWNVSESELFDIMEDLAVECYYNRHSHQVISLMNLILKNL